MRSGGGEREGGLTPGHPEEVKASITHLPWASTHHTHLFYLGDPLPISSMFLFTGYLLPTCRAVRFLGTQAMTDQPG